jgi:hypothetical protein
MEDMTFGQAVRRTVVSAKTPALITKEPMYVKLNECMLPNSVIQVNSDGLVEILNAGLYQLSYTVAVDIYGGQNYVESCLYMQELGQPTGQQLEGTRQVSLQSEDVVNMGNTTFADLQVGCTLGIQVSAAQERKAALISANARASFDGLNVTASITVLQLS